MKKLLLVLSFFTMTIVLYAISTAKGKAIFECKMEGTEGKIEVFKNDTDHTKVGEMNFEKDEAPCKFRYILELDPGNYSWQFADNKKNKASGGLFIKSGDIATISVFENK